MCRAGLRADTGLAPRARALLSTSKPEHRMSNVPVMTIGAVALHRVEELRIPNSIAYFTSDAELLAANRHWLAPHFLDENDRFDLCFQSWIFVIDGRVGLVDPCTGNGRPHPVHFFDNLDVPFIDRLDETGFRCE